MQITYDDKVTLNENTSIADINKVKASDMNMIKQVVNANQEDVGNIADLKTTDVSSIVNAINETVDKARANKTFFLTSNYTINSNAVTPINESKISLKTNGGKILAIISAPVHGAGAGSPRMGISVDGVLKSNFILAATQNVINSYSTIFDLEAGTHEFAIVMFKSNDSSVTFQAYLGSSLTIIEL